MRIFIPNFAPHNRSRGRFHDLTDFQFKYYRTPILKDKVSGKGEKDTRAVCIEPMMLMLSCFKDNSFDDKPCSKFVDAFKNCVSEQDLLRIRRKEARLKGTSITIDGVEQDIKLNSSQLTTLLRKFREPL